MLRETRVSGSFEIRLVGTPVFPANYISVITVFTANTCVILYTTNLRLRHHPFRNDSPASDFKNLRFTFFIFQYFVLFRLLVVDNSHATRNKQGVNVSERSQRCSAPLPAVSPPISSFPSSKRCNGFCFQADCHLPIIPTVSLENLQLGVAELFRNFKTLTETVVVRRSELHAVFLLRKLKYR